MNFMGERLNIKNLMIEPERRPERPFDLERDITDKDRQALEDFYANAPESTHAMDMAACAAILGREFKKTKSPWLHASRLQTARASGDYGDLARVAAHLAVSGKQPGLREEDWVQVSEVLAGLRQESQWPIFERLAAYMRVLDHDPGLSSSDWHHLKQRLKESRVDNPDHLKRIIPDLAILATDEVRILQGGGLELVFKNDAQKTETSPLPEQRKF